VCVDPLPPNVPKRDNPLSFDRTTRADVPSTPAIQDIEKPGILRKVTSAEGVALSLPWQSASIAGFADREGFDDSSAEHLRRHLRPHEQATLAHRATRSAHRGYLIIDDTGIPKPFATAIEALAWVYSSQERKPVYGLALVLLVWTNGTVRIPLGMRFWHKGGPSKYVLALELLSYARNRLRCRPDYVLFDAWYPSKSLLKRIRDSGRYFVCRLKKNRRFNGHQATRQLERLLITRALARSQGNKAEAARLLQIRRQHLYAKLKELGIE
jgi:hypothetical protein